MPPADAHKAAAATGLFHPRDAIGQKWSKLPSSDPAKMEYESKATMAEKKQVKKAWAKEKFKYVLSEKTHEQGFRRVDTTKGIMMTFGNLVQDLGGGGIGHRQ